MKVSLLFGIPNFININQLNEVNWTGITGANNRLLYNM